MTGLHRHCERDALKKERDELREALSNLVDVIEAAELLNLSNGVQLGPTVWYVKASECLVNAVETLERIK